MLLNEQEPMNNKRLRELILSVLDGRDAREHTVQDLLDVLAEGMDSRIPAVIARLN